MLGNQLINDSQEKKSYVLISIIAIIFGAWFANRQIHAVAQHEFFTYPFRFYLLTVAKCYLTIIAVFSFSRLIWSHFTFARMALFPLAVSFSPLLLVLIHVPLYFIVSAIFAIQLITALTALKRNDYQFLMSRYLGDGIVLSLFFLFHLILTSRFSPLHWGMSLLTADGYNSEEIYVLAPIFKGYVLAKQFAFSNIDHAQWAGIMNPPVNLGSPLMQLLEFVLDLPSASYQAFHTMILALNFLLMIVGSFGFYLFLKYACKITSLFAFLGGFVLMFAGSPLLGQMFTSDGGIFLAPFSVFPYALLLASFSFIKNDYRYAMWAGLALASQLFILTPHPEGIIYSLAFFSMYLSGLFLFSWHLTWRYRMLLSFLPIFTFFVLTSFYLVPLMMDKLTGNMYVFAHTGDVNVTYFVYFKRFTVLLLLFGALSLTLRAIYKDLSLVFLSSLFYAFCMLGCIYIILDIDMVARVIRMTHIGLHIWVPSRIGVYFYMSVYIIVMYGLDAVTRFVSDMIRNKIGYRVSTAA